MPPLYADESERDRITEYNAMCGKRAATLKAWADAGHKIALHPKYQRATPREAAVAIGWVPWPSAWPGSDENEEIDAAA